MVVENVDVNGGHCYINTPTVSESKNHNFIYSTKKRGAISLNRSEMEMFLQCGVAIDVMLPLSTLNKCSNMEYNNKHNKLSMNGNI